MNGVFCSLHFCISASLHLRIFYLGKGNTITTQTFAEDSSDYLITIVFGYKFCHRIGHVWVRGTLWPNKPSTWTPRKRLNPIVARLSPTRARVNPIRVRVNQRRARVNPKIVPQVNRLKKKKNPNVFAVPLPWRSSTRLLAIQNPTDATGVTNHEKSNFEHVTFDFTYFPFATVFITRLKIRLKGDYNELYHLNKKQIYLFPVDSHQLDDYEYRCQRRCRGGHIMKNQILSNVYLVCKPILTWHSRWRTEWHSRSRPKKARGDEKARRGKLEKQILLKKLFWLSLIYTRKT